MVSKYQNADCSLKNKFSVSFIIIFGTLSCPVQLQQSEVNLVFSLSCVTAITVINFLSP